MGFRRCRGVFTAFNGRFTEREGGMYIDGGSQYQATNYDSGGLSEHVDKSTWLRGGPGWVNFLVYSIAWHGGLLTSSLRTRNESEVPRNPRQ